MICLFRNNNLLFPSFHSFNFTNTKPYFTKRLCPGDWNRFFLKKKDKEKKLVVNELTHSGTETRGEEFQFTIKIPEEMSYTLCLELSRLFVLWLQVYRNIFSCVVSAFRMYKPFLPVVTKGIWKHFGPVTSLISCLHLVRSSRLKYIIVLALKMLKHIESDCILMVFLITKEI